MLALAGLAGVGVLATLMETIETVVAGALEVILAMGEMAQIATARELLPLEQAAGAAAGAATPAAVHHNMAAGAAA